MFGNSNPFKKASKVTKTLIATPSKFEIRRHTTREATKKVSVSPKKAGVRGKLAAVKKVVAKPVPKVVKKVIAKPAAKVSTKSKPI